MHLHWFTEDPYRYAMRCRCGRTLGLRAWPALEHAWLVLHDLPWRWRRLRGAAE